VTEILIPSPPAYLQALNLVWYRAGRHPSPFRGDGFVVSSAEREGEGASCKRNFNAIVPK